MTKRKRVPALVVLEDGRWFEGLAAGASGQAVGEVVFNTSMTGYQEILTDPSCRGHLLTFTVPHVGNCGVNPGDNESPDVHAAGVIVRNLSRLASNYRATMSFQDWLEANGTVAISDVDTRALTRHIRDRGAMMAAILHEATREDVARGLELIASRPRYGSRELVSRVACAEPMAAVFEEGSHVAGQLATGLRELAVRLVPLSDPGLQVDEARPHVVVVDFGVKHGILRSLHRAGFRVSVVPAGTSVDDVAALEPAGVVLSNGPGDPAVLDEHLPAVRALSERFPTLGICLGHQLLARALGARTYKLPFGHRGPNQPVLDLRRGTVAMTSQNHGFAVDAESIGDALVVTHLNLNDRTVEGFRHRTLPVSGVQYHPEAGPGPHDADACFEDFAHDVRAHL